MLKDSKSTPTNLSSSYLTKYATWSFFLPLFIAIDKRAQGNGQRLRTVLKGDWGLSTRSLSLCDRRSAPPRGDWEKHGCPWVSPWDNAVDHSCQVDLPGHLSPVCGGLARRSGLIREWEEERGGGLARWFPGPSQQRDGANNNNASYAFVPW